MGLLKYVIGLGRIKREKKEGTYIPETQIGKVRICMSCKQKITPDQGYTKQIGHYFHRKCWKKERKAANT